MFNYLWNFIIIIIAATLTIPVGAASPGNPSYEPVSLTVKRGDEIDVVNKDSSPHTATNGKGPDDPDTGKKFVHISLFLFSVNFYTISSIP